EAMTYLREHGKTRIEADSQAQEEWVDHVNKVADSTLYPLANSWYMGANIPGKPRVFMPYVGGFAGYKKRCDAIAAEGYPGFRLS
ncbi:MAG: cyclohexanone monooxygenase, partial [Proteobacteria bacterium]|nr:cyclohexanone monooxygenase [Pseudomonadota bacterium]